MRVIYNFIINCYGLAMFCAALFNSKAKSWVNGRKNYFDKLPSVPSDQVIWFHCASLGEFDMALPLMKRMKDEQEDAFILTTFFSPSGINHYYKRNHCVDLAINLPLDTPENARRFIKHFRPKQAFFVKYEFWINFMREAKLNNVSVFSVCTLLREKQRFFRWYGHFFRKNLKLIDFFYVQNEQTAVLLKKIGLNNSLIVGDLRFDRVIENKKQLFKNEQIELFLNGAKAMIFGSTWPKDERLVFTYIKQNSHQKYIIAPHQVEEAHIVSIEQALPGITCRYSEVNPSKNVLILNTIGHLSSAYFFAKIAYIGGGFSGKLHNILEPAVFGVPVIFGPNYERFPEAIEFINRGVGFSVESESSFSKIIKLIEATSPEIKSKLEILISENKGATNRILNHINAKQLN